MRYWISVVLLVLSISGIGQSFIENRISPIINSSKNYSSSLNLHYIVNNFDCPPKLHHNKSDHFTFLDSLPLNPQFEEELLSLFMVKSCKNYYSILTQYLLAKPFYDSVLKTNDVNTKFSVLPLIISGCNPTLKYEGDKSGEWQLSYINARKYGLHINQWEDERNSRTLSTLAAASYLHFLDEYYLSNELLIFTAFYTSVPFVNKHINALDTVNSVNFYNALPAEIQGHFSYLKSWNNWLEHFKQPKIDNATASPKLWTAVETKDTLSFETIAKFMNVSMDDLRNRNPVLVGEKVFPNSNTSFYLPREKADHFQKEYEEFVAFQKEEEIRKQEELEKLRKQMESGIPDLKTHKAITYTVKSGDVLGKIADKHNVKVSQIKQWNSLKSDRINIGQKLTIYVPKNSSVAVKEEKPSNKIETKPTVAKPGKGTPEIYTVKNGESLWLIAKKFPGVSAEDIMKWNGCTDKISPGMQLKIYQPNN
ncbi:MAG: LysM peptidoglycan-binding domain-containing protein [Salibacteraceae bacterium]